MAQLFFPLGTLIWETFYFPLIFFSSCPSAQHFPEEVKSRVDVFSLPAPSLVYETATHTDCSSKSRDEGWGLCLLLCLHVCPSEAVPAPASPRCPLAVRESQSWTRIRMAWAALNWPAALALPQSSSVRIHRGEPIPPPPPTPFLSDSIVQPGLRTIVVKRRLSLPSSSRR